MSTKSRTIELDEATAAELRGRAGERGMSVPDLVAEYVGENRAQANVDFEQIAELDRRWAAVEAGQLTVPNDRVARWLGTWGAPAYKPWRDQ